MNRTIVIFWGASMMVLTACSANFLETAQSLPQDNGGSSSVEGLTLVSSSPEAGESNVLLDASITLHFNKELALGEGFEATLSSASETNSIDAVDDDLNGSALVLSPTQSLDFDTEYTLTIRAGSLGVVGSIDNANNNIQLQFRTEADELRLVSSSPSNNEINVAEDFNIELLFNRRVTLSEADLTGTLVLGEESGRLWLDESDITNKTLLMHFSIEGMFTAETYATQTNFLFTLPANTLHKIGDDTQTNDEIVLRFSTVGP